MELKDVLGTCTLIFKQQIADLIQFGNKGRLLIAKENSLLTANTKVTEISSKLFELDDKDLETQIKQALKWKPTKVILFEYKGSLVNHVTALNGLKFDWFICLDSTEQQTVSDYCDEKEIFGLVHNVNANSKWVVSLQNSSAKLSNGVTINDSSTINGIGLLPIVGGALAGCPYTNSITAFTFDELESVDEIEIITQGQLVLYNEEEGVRAANSNNTLTTIAGDDTADMKDITIMESIRRYKQDLRKSFRLGYKGKKNKYDNQQLFISAIKGYHSELESDEVDILDPEYENDIFIDTDKVRKLWISSGKNEEEINAMSDLEISKLTYKKTVALKAKVKFLNAIEECEIEVEMY